MVVKIGSIEFNVTLLNPVKPIEHLTIEDLAGATVSIFAPALQEAKDVALARVESITETVAESLPTLTDTHDSTHLLALLKRIDFSNFTIAMIVKKVFRIKMSQEEVGKKFEDIAWIGKNWLNTPIKDELWGIYLGRINTPVLGEGFVAVGINKAQQYVFLGMTEKSEEALYDILRKRKVKLGQIQFGMLSFSYSDKLFRKNVPEAYLVRDWHEFCEMHDDENDQDDIKAMMVSTNKKEVEQFLKEIKGPAELLNYMKMDPEYWRALRTAVPIEKIERELTTNTKMFKQQQLKNTDEIDFIKQWSLLRLQYHWFKVPLNSKVFKNFVNQPHEVYSIKS